MLFRAKAVVVLCGASWADTTETSYYRMHVQKHTVPFFRTLTFIFATLIYRVLQLEVSRNRPGGSWRYVSHQGQEQLGIPWLSSVAPIYLFCFFFQDRFLLYKCSSGCPGIHYIIRRPGWPQNSQLFCLLSAVIKGVSPYTQFVF